MAIKRHLLAGVVVLAALSVPIVAGAQDSWYMLPVDTKTIKMVVDGDKIYCPQTCDRPKMKIDGRLVSCDLESLPPWQCLMMRNISDPQKVVQLFGVEPSSWDMMGKAAYSLSQMPGIGATHMRPSFCKITMVKDVAGDCAVLGEDYTVKGLEQTDPKIKDELYGAGVMVGKPILVCNVVAKVDAMAVYFVDDNKRMRVFECNDKGEWRNIGEYPFPVKDFFNVIPGENPLIFTASGELYRLTKDKAVLVSKVDIPKTDVSATTAPVADAAAKSSTPATLPAKQQAASRLVMLDIRKDGKADKYALLLWQNNEFKALDVLDSDGKNVEPFLPALKVSKEVIAAATSMMPPIIQGEEKTAKLREKMLEKMAGLVAKEEARAATRPAAVKKHLEE